MKDFFIKTASAAVMLAMISPALAQAYDAEAYTQARVSLLDEAQQSTLRSDLLNAIDQGVRVLEANSDADNASLNTNAEELISAMNRAGDAEGISNNVNFVAFMKHLRRNAQKKSFALNLNGAEQIAKLNELKTKVQDTEKLKFKLVLDVLKALAGVAYCYAVLFFIGAGPIFSFLLSIFGGALGVFGVYLALFLTLGVGLALVIAPVVIYKKLKHDRH